MNRQVCAQSHAHANFVCARAWKPQTALESWPSPRSLLCVCPSQQVVNYCWHEEQLAQNIQPPTRTNAQTNQPDKHMQTYICPATRSHSLNDTHFWPQQLVEEGDCNSNFFFLENQDVSSCKVEAFNIFHYDPCCQTTHAHSQKCDKHMAKFLTLKPQQGKYINLTVTEKHTYSVVAVTI